MSRRHRRKRVGVMVPVASMGDIAFLLIAFFVLASQFRVDIPVDPPKSEDIDLLEDLPPVTLTIDEDKAFFLDGNPIEASQVGAEITAATSGIADRERRTVLVKADLSLTYSDIEPVLEAIAEAGVPLALGGNEAKTPAPDADDQ